jgi:hypothetical protein
LPAAWKHANSFCLFKKGSRSDLPLTGSSPSRASSRVPLRESSRFQLLS